MDTIQMTYEVKSVKYDTLTENGFDLYVNWPGSEKELLACIARQTFGKTYIRTITCGPITVDVFKNQTIYKNLTGDLGENFIYFPFRLEIEMEKSESYRPLLLFVAGLIGHFRIIGIEAVAAGELENELTTNRSF